MSNTTISVPAGSTLLTEKFINSLMLRGKKTVARKIFRDMIEILRSKGKKNPEELFQRAIDTVKPKVEVKAKRIGGSVYQIPTEVTADRQLTLAIRWIVQACRQRKGRGMAELLADEVMQAAQEQGTAYKKKMDVFRMAEANRAFAHLAKYTS